MDVDNKDAQKTSDEDPQSSVKTGAKVAAFVVKNDRPQYYLAGDPTIGTALTSHDAIGIEWTLRRLTTAAAELMACERDTTIMRASQMPPDIDLRTLWSLGLENFHQNLQPALAYVRHMPAFMAMPISDRCRLFSHSYLPLVVTQLSLPPNNGHQFFGYNSYNAAIFFRKFPHYQPLGERVDEISHALNRWRPSSVESALLMASLFYQDALPGLTNPLLVFNVSQRLKVVLNAVSRQYGDCDLRLRYFMQTFDLLRCAQQCAVEGSTDLYNNNSDDLPEDRLFQEIYVRRQRSSSPFCNDDLQKSQASKGAGTESGEQAPAPAIKVDNNANKNCNQTPASEQTSELAQLLSINPIIK